ncbi:SCO1860 family LAETG-anchored protein [Streptomyces sp. CAU 1734]|uniref:SCO1860 family LAETG-anchored protein n=1 Tax=Streptomyces sp. CAU 1734 TaxID=3140360 RepID=UPI0032603D60
MNSNTFRMPARRCAAVTAAVALAATPVALAGPAQAGPGGAQGGASAVVLRTGLDVSLLDKTLRVPLAASLNEVRAPASASRTALSVRLDGVGGGRPVQILRADAATSRATADKKRAEGFARLVRARVHVPGLPLLSLIEVEQVTSRASCPAGRKPAAESNLLGHVKVLGKTVTLSAGGPSRVTVPGVGEVSLDLSRTRTTSRTAAATALELKVSVNPLALNVADVKGTVTLVRAACESPAAAVKPPAEQEQEQKPPVKHEPKGESVNLAETGGSSTTPYVAGGAAVLLAAGAGALLLTRRRRGARGRG